MSNKFNMQSMTPQRHQEAAARSGLVFVPEVHHPVFALAIIQHMIRGGALYWREHYNDIPARHFGDGFAWSHLQQVMGLFAFGVPIAAVKIMIAVMHSVIFVCVAIFGHRGAWKFWNAIFESAVTGARVNFPDSSEMVANLEITGDDEDEGHDAYFPTYYLQTMRTLEVSVKEAEATRWVTAAVNQPAGSYARVAMDGLLRITMERSQEMTRGPGRVSFGGTPLGGSLAVQILKTNPQLLNLQPDQLENQTERTNVAVSVFGGSMFTQNSSQSWTKRMLALQKAPLGKLPAWPVEGMPISTLDNLAEIQKFGSERQIKGTNRVAVHGGIDIPANEGAKIYALYTGRVHAIERNWDEESNPGSRGNFVILRHDADPTNPGDEFSTTYLHLAEVNDLKVGDTVKKGAVLGTAGSTGNSTGTHLHLGAHWSGRDIAGRSLEKKALDPELVLRRGAIEAARMSGVSLGAVQQPDLAVPIFTLGSIAGGVSNPYMGADTTAIDEQMRAMQAWAREIAGEKEGGDGGDGGASGGALDDFLNSNAVKTGQAAFASALDQTEKGKFGRIALETAYRTQGLPADEILSVLDVLHAGYDAGEKSGYRDSGAMTRAAISHAQQVLGKWFADNPDKRDQLISTASEYATQFGAGIFKRPEE